MDPGIPRPDDFEPGDELSAEALNEWAEYASGSRMRPGGGLQSAYGPDGSVMRMAAPRRPIMALLSGSSSPYSWTQKVCTAAGTLSTGPLSGTNAYETNGTASLGGNTVRLFPDGMGGWWFTSKCCTGSTVTLCSCTVPTTLTCTYARYDLSNTLIAGPATVSMAYLSEVAFSGCTSRGAGFRSTTTLDPAVYSYPDPWDGIDRYLVVRCNIITVEMRVISPSPGCFYGPNFAASVVCSPFVVVGNDAPPGLSPYNKYTLTP